MPELNSFSLKNLCNKFGIKVDGAHRSTSDTRMVRKLYHALCQKLVPKVNNTYEELIQNPSMVYNYLYE